MTVTFDKLQVGCEYDRNFLAEIWGYKDYHAIGRGVVTPANSRLIVLFVTEEKQPSAQQYKDRVEGSLLFWEGEDKHGSDQRIIEAGQNGDEIHLFYRKLHHAAFVYYGKLKLRDCREKAGAPSKFIFQILS